MNKGRAKSLAPDERQGRLFGVTPSGGIDLNPTVPAADKPRLSRQHRLILERLALGSATNVELSGIGLRFGARLQELREAGYNIVTEERGGGLVVYKWEKARATGSPDYPD